MNQKIEQALKKLFKKKFSDIFRYYIPRINYSHYYKTLKLDEKAVLFESQHGTGMQGNVFYMLRAMANDPQYDDYELYLSCRKANKEEFRELLDSNGMQRVKTVIVSTRTYMKLLASAKYLVNDNTFLPFFIKRDGQVYLNTWHGTPLKTLGKQIHNAMYGIGNTQKNFMVADYLLYPNEYTMEHMVEDYMLSNVSSGKVILGGYPRNEAFFDRESEAKIREEIEIADKKIYAFMPTWRGAVGAIDPKATTYVQYYLYEMDKRLADDEVMYVNLHPIARKDVNFRGFKHIRQFPKGYETYEFLNAADCLITDYSSVFYDFAVSRKKCILFTYDEEEYFADRGLYRPLSSLPFPSVKTVDELFKELRSPKNYDDTEFLKEYCTYDCPNASKVLCEKLIFGKDSKLFEEREIPNNGKPNVLVYAGNLGKNGITTSIMNLLNNIDRTENNYFITFRAGAVKPNQEILSNLPEGVNYIATTGKMNLSFFKKAAWLLCKARKFPVNTMMKMVKEDLKLELRRDYGDMNFDTIVQFNGYEFAKIFLYSAFEGNKVIYVHNDMVQEATVRRNQRKDVLKYAYEVYDHVALVTEDLVEPTTVIAGKERSFDLAHNLINYNSILERGAKDIAFDPYTQSNIPFERVVEILNSSSKKIVNVARFSPEKGQRRLIDAFQKLLKDEPDSYLFIIGGNQFNGMYNQLCEYVATLPCADHIVLILAMSNPLPIVKACDGFILSSLYEGFGLVLVEADILGLPVVSTDIVGPRTFMQKHEGVLVEDSEAGIENGLRRLVAGDIPKLTVDYAEYNRNAVEEFIALLEKKNQN